MSLAPHLGILESSGLIRLASAEPDLEYLFRHPLVQDAAYNSLVKVDRRTLHRAVGEALEALYEQRAASLEVAPLLAQHFAEGGDDERALKYYQAAGEAARRVYALPEAIAHYSAALQAARRVEKKTESHLDGERWSDLYTGLGTALELLADYSAAIARYGELEALGRERNERGVRLAAVMARAKIHATINPAYDPPLARALLEQALELARAGQEDGDRAVEARILWNWMLMETFAGTDMQHARELGEQSLALARKFGLREQIAFTLHDLHYSYAYTGHPDLSEAALDESRSLWREMGNQAMLSDNLSNKGIRQTLNGQFEAAKQHCAEAREISRAINNVWGEATSNTFMGRANAEQGNFGAAIAAMEEGIRIGGPLGHHAILVAGCSDVAWLLGELGQWDKAFARADEAVAAGAAFEFWKSWALATVARLHLARGNRAQAEGALAEAQQAIRPGSIQFLSPMVTALAEIELELARGRAAEALAAVDRLDEMLAFLGMPVLRPEMLYLAGRARLAQGRPDEARAAWETARAEAQASGARRSLWPVLAALSQLEAEQGNQAEALALRREAQTIVEYIAAHAGSPERAASFRALEQVRAVLAEEMT